MLQITQEISTNIIHDDLVRQEEAVWAIRFAFSLIRQEGLRSLHSFARTPLEGRQETEELFYNCRL